MALQTITLPDERYPQYLRNSDFIQQYIFPGGCLLSRKTIKEQVSKHTDLEICEVVDIGLHYAETLRRWRKNFQRYEQEIRALGYSNEFIRMWHYYFCYCEAGFEEGYLHNLQILMRRRLENETHHGMLVQ